MKNVKHTGCLTLLEILEIYWNFFPPGSLLEIFWFSLWVCR